MNDKDGTFERVSKGLMGLVLGLVLAAAGTMAGRQLHIVWNIWPSTDGVVLRGGVQEVLQAPSAKGGLPVRRYTPKVNFRFAAGGREYDAEAQSVSTADTYAEAAAKVARLYAPGTHHPIRYNPRDPREIQFGTVELGSLVLSFLLLIAGVVFATIGARTLAGLYPRGTELAGVKERGAPAPVLPFVAKAQPPAAAPRLRCPACGQAVKAMDDTCSNCMKALRAA